MAICLAKVPVGVPYSTKSTEVHSTRKDERYSRVQKHILGFSQSYFLFLYVKYRREVKNGRDFYDIGYCDHFAHSCMFYWKSGSGKGHKRIPYTLWAAERI